MSNSPVITQTLSHRFRLSCWGGTIHRKRVRVSVVSEESREWNELVSLAAHGTVREIWK